MFAVGYSCFIRTFVVAAVALVFADARAQTYTYDFGSGTGVFNNGSTTTPLSSTSFAPQATSGQSFVSAGTGGGSVTLQNPGDASLGSGTELVITAASNTSPNKFSIYDHTATTLSQLSFSSVLNGNSGGFILVTGNGTSFSGNGTGAPTSLVTNNTQVFTGLRFDFGGTAQAPTVTTTYLSGATYVNTGLSATAIVTGSVLQFDIIGNNSIGALTYNRSGLDYGVAAHTWDLFLNGTLIGDDLAAGRLTSGTTIDSFALQGVSSTGNVGTMAIDDITYGPLSAVPEPATCVASVLALAVIGYQFSVIRRKRVTRVS